MFRLGIRSAALSAALAFCVSHAQAQADFPSRNLTIVVPFAAGGPTDTVARLLAENMTQTLGQPVIVENAAGAGGTIAATRVARANPDGYTLLLHHIGHATSAALYRKLPYDPSGDFAGIGLITDVPMTVVGRAELPPKTPKEMIDYVKANKDKVTLANAGLGSVSHLCGMLLQEALGTQMTTVPYKGTGPAMNDLLGGQVDLLCDQTTNTTSPINAGKIKAYAATTRERVKVLPDLPTLDESGLKGFEVAAWHGLYAPKATPKPVIDKTADALRTALKSPKVVERFASLGTVPVSPDKVTPAALDQYLKAEIIRWKPIIQAAGVYAD